MDTLTPETIQHWVSWQQTQWKQQAERDKVQLEIVSTLKAMLRR